MFERPDRIRRFLHTPQIEAERSSAGAARG
jgi:hypothetical protein